MVQPIRRPNGPVPPRSQRGHPGFRALTEGEACTPIGSPARTLQRRLEHNFAGGLADPVAQPQYSTLARLTILFGSAALTWWCIYALAGTLIG